MLLPDTHLIAHHCQCPPANPQLHHDSSSFPPPASTPTSLPFSDSLTHIDPASCSQVHPLQSPRVPRFQMARDSRDLGPFPVTAPALFPPSLPLPPELGFSSWIHWGALKHSGCFGFVLLSSWRCLSALLFFNLILFAHSPGFPSPPCPPLLTAQDCLLH